MTTEYLLLKSLVTTLEGVKNTNNQPVFNLVDEFTGQYEDEDGNPLWTTPAALIEMQDIEWGDEINAKIQVGTFRFRVHFVDDTGFDDKQRRLDTNHAKNTSFGVNILRHKRFKFSDLSIPLDDVFINTINRRRTEFVNNLAETVATIVEFECEVTDYSLMPIWVEVIVPIVTKLYIVENEFDFKQQTE